MEGSSETTADWIWTMSIRGESALCVCVCVACSCTYQGEQFLYQIKWMWACLQALCSWVMCRWFLRQRCGCWEQRDADHRSGLFLSVSFLCFCSFAASWENATYRTSTAKKEPKERLDSLLLLSVKDPTQLRLVWQMISGVLTMELISIIHYLYLQDGL